jgi:ubiquinone/menaquinone biosynthesis C-methylase UbiE
MTNVEGAEWDAQAYDRLGNPMQSFGETVLAGLHVRGDETALDLGCGSGRLTELLAERLPQGRIIAVDRSANMLAQARERMQPIFGDRVEYLQCSLDDLDLDGVADLAFSNAALHWIKDHPRLFRAIFRSLRPGGRLVAQCGGGRQHIAQLRERAGRLMTSPPYAPYFGEWDGPWEFADPDTTRQRLESAGFVDVSTGLVHRPVVLADAHEYREFLEHVVFGTHAERLPEHLRPAFLDALAAPGATDDPPFSMDYWRLNISARRP